MTDKTSTAPVMSLRDVSVKLRSHADFMGSLGGSGELMDSVELASCADAIDAHLNAPTPDVVGGDVVAKARDLIKRLRDTPNWVKEPWGDFKSAGANTFDRAPKEAADLIETLIAAARVQCDAEPAEVTDKQIRCIAACIADGRYVSQATARNEAFLKSLRNALHEASSAAQHKSDELVRYCPECSLTGDVPVGARDCCPDGSAARMIPRHIAHAAHRDFHHSIKTHPAAQPKSVANAELTRLRAIEHHAWHLLDESGDAGDGLLTVLKGVDYEALDRLLPEDHPVIADDEPSRMASHPAEQTRGDGAASTVNGTPVSAEVWALAKSKHPHNGDMKVGYAHGYAEALTDPRQAVPDGLTKDAARWKFFAQCGWPVSFLGQSYDNAIDLDAAVDNAIAAAPSAGRMGVES